MKTLKKICYSVGVILLLIVMMLMCTAVVQLIMVTCIKVKDITISDYTLYSVSGTIGIALAGIIIAGYIRKKQCESREIQNQKVDIKKLLLYGVLAVCVCQILFDTVAALLFAHVFPLKNEQSQGSNIYIDILCGVVLAPIGEEMLFRSGLYSLLKRKLKPVTAIVISAFIFAILHGYNLLGITSCFFAGIFFAIVYERTGNVWYSIFTHLMCNLFTLTFNTMEQRDVTLMGSPIQYEINGYNAYNIVVILMAVLFCIAAYMHKSKLNTEERKCLKY